VKSPPGDQEPVSALETFGRAFDDHANAVYRHAVRLSGDWSTAEDVVSLTFLEAWRLRDRLRPGSELRPWLLGVATNVLRNVRRAARRHRAALQRLPPPTSTPDIAEDVVGRIHDADQLAAAVAALQRLRRTEREVFALCVWSGLNYSAAADALGIPVGTVRSRLSRARARLRALTDAELTRDRHRTPSTDAPSQPAPSRADRIRSWRVEQQ
jgi:RNA polymerase sigma factor (sigma-70 family)